MKIPLYQVDAFSRTVFGGNPAAVCSLGEWLPDAVMQSIASENNLAETAFFSGAAGRYDLRWFTPLTEVKLCGHATLASAFVICTYLERGLQRIEFNSQSGGLTVTRKDELYELDFPARPCRELNGVREVEDALGGKPCKAFASAEDHLVVFETEDQIPALAPNMDKVSRLNCRGVIVTAPGNSYDFVSRFFAPKVGIPEDPVTGSAHCALIPYWSSRLGKAKLFARQISARGGELFCELRGERVGIAGYVAPYLCGEIEV
jgi:PhzF family phenazine biosynthesis protein